MTVTRRTALRAGCALLAGCLAGAVPLAEAHSPPPLAARLVHVEVVDRSNGATLPVYEHAGRLHIAGEPGREYAIRIRNLTGGRVLAVTSVDGVNVITGDTASPGQSGYVLDPHGSLEIAGWRKSLSRTAAFFFSDHANSYASRTGRPLDVGVIGVAAFAERARPPVRIGAAAPFAGRQASAEAKAEPSADAQPPASAPAESRRDEADVRERSAAAPQPMAKLGTGHGRSETSYARQVTFERSTSDPLQVVALHYDRYENLAALGIVPARHDPYARRTPQPFPGMRFAADPR